MPRKLVDRVKVKVDQYAVVQTVTEGKTTWNRVFTGYPSRPAAQRAVNAFRREIAARQADQWRVDSINPNTKFVFAVADEWGQE